MPSMIRDSKATRDGRPWIQSLCAAICLLYVFPLSVYSEDELALVTDGDSAFTIVIPMEAPKSVSDAAEELQKDIQLATKATLPIQKDGKEVNGPFISVGATVLSTSAGLSTAELKDDGYRILCRDGNLYILGLDTAKGEKTKGGGTSSGTANGVYVFLEDYLDVRWLMPGELGRDVPTRESFVLPAINRTEAPLFTWREVTHLDDYATPEQSRLAREWSDHMRLGISTRIDHEPRWWEIMERYPENPKFSKKKIEVDIKRVADPRNDLRTPGILSAYGEHPEWFAMDRVGNRPFPNGIKAKLETTNPDLVQFFANEVAEILKKSEVPITFSLSPTDGGDWSESPESRALYDPEPEVAKSDSEVTVGRPSMSSLVLKWYDDIAKIVAEKYPEGRLSGYLYSSYVYPPVKLRSQLPSNFTPIIAPSGTYGYGLYDAHTQKYYKHVTDSWSQVVSGDWFSYSLPNQFLRYWQAEIGVDNFPGTTGTVTAPGAGILNLYYGQLVKSGIKGGKTYGVPSWSNAALGNYLLAKMHWDPTSDAAQVQHDWLMRAYGPDAGRVMEGFYQKLEAWFEEAFHRDSARANMLSLDRLQSIFGAHFPEMEGLFLEATSQPMTEVQKKRLQLIENNLIVLHWRLKNMLYLPEGFVSTLARENKEIAALLVKENADFQLFPGAVAPDWNKQRGYFRAIPESKPLPWKVVSASAVEAPETQSFPPRSSLGEGQFLLYANRDAEIRIRSNFVSHGAYFGTFTLHDSKGKLIQSGLLEPSLPIVVPAKKGEVYVLYLALRSMVYYKLSVDDASVPQASFAQGVLSLHGDDAPIYLVSSPQEAPIGVIEENNQITILHPYSGSMLHAKMQSYRDKRLLDALDEGWVFQPDPEDKLEAQGVTLADYDDREWTPVSPHNWWQFQGFPDYRGVAWYRVRFVGKELRPDEQVRLYFGGVDGHAEVYLNGEKITEHLLGPKNEGWDKAFSTSISSSNRMKAGEENTIVVKVTSKPSGGSGIFRGVAIIGGYSPNR